MSRIRKALEELHDESRTGSPGLQNQPGPNVSTRVTDGENPAFRKAANNPADKTSADALISASGEEWVPSHRLQVDRHRLEEERVMAGAEHAQLIAQQFRRIKRPILQLAFDPKFAKSTNDNVIMMASTLPGAGKSFCAFNLAFSIAMERDVGAILIDADVLKPQLSRDLGLEEHIGLIDYLLDPKIAVDEILVATDINDIIVVPAGQQHPHATELLASRRMQEFVAILAAKFSSRAVIFDAPPLLLTNEAQVLAQIMGQIVLVIEDRVTTQESALRAVAMLDRRKPINAILNKSREASEGNYHGYDYGYYSYPRRN